MSAKQNILIITGLAGAGMSSALKILEDIGYEAFDNFPLTLAQALVEDEAASHPFIAIGIDSRTRGFEADAIAGTAAKLGAKLVFITCDDTVLQRRFTETRRRHPLAKDRPAAAGIKREQELMFSLRAHADIVIDTTFFSVHDLRRNLEGHFGPAGGKSRLAVSLVSFGFRFGLPREADMVLDVRFLKNPYWDHVLRPLTGMDAAVGAYIEQDESFAPFLEKTQALASFLLPRYVLEGKAYLTLAVGCTGGHHRSVYVTEKLKPRIAAQGYEVSILHRDIAR